MTYSSSAVCSLFNLQRYNREKQETLIIVYFLVTKVVDFVGAGSLDHTEFLYTPRVQDGKKRKGWDFDINGHKTGCFENIATREIVSDFMGP